MDNSITCGRAVSAVREDAVREDVPIVFRVLQPTPSPSLLVQAHEHPQRPQAPSHYRHWSCRGYCHLRCRHRCYATYTPPPPLSGLWFLWILLVRLLGASPIFAESSHARQASRCERVSSRAVVCNWCYCLCLSCVVSHATYLPHKYCVLLTANDHCVSGWMERNGARP